MPPENNVSFMNETGNGGSIFIHATDNYINRPIIYINAPSTRSFHKYKDKKIKE